MYQKVATQNALFLYADKIVVYIYIIIKFECVLRPTTI